MEQKLFFVGMKLHQVFKLSKWLKRKTKAVAGFMEVRENLVN